LDGEAIHSVGGNVAQGNIDVVNVDRHAAHGVGGSHGRSGGTRRGLERERRRGQHKAGEILIFPDNDSGDRGRFQPVLQFGSR